MSILYKLVFLSILLTSLSVAFANESDDEITDVPVQTTTVSGSEVESEELEEVTPSPVNSALLEEDTDEDEM